MKRRHYTNEEKKYHVNALIESGLSNVQYAARNGLSEHIVRRWKMDPRYNQTITGEELIKKAADLHRTPPTYSDEFKRKQVAEYKAQNSLGVVKFAKGRGFSDAALRNWLLDPRYTQQEAPSPTLEQKLPPAVSLFPLRPSKERDEKLTALIGKLIVRLMELDPNFTI